MATVNVMRDGVIVEVDDADYAEPGVDVATIRAATSIEMLDFMEALLDSDEITDAEFGAWTSGTVPTSVEADLSAVLSGDALVKARARVIKSTSVNRMNEIVLLLKARRSLTDAQVDALFGIST